MPFCHICGEVHRPDFCPEFGPVPYIKSEPHAEDIKAVAPEAPKARPVIVANLQRGAVFPVAKIFDPSEGRPFTPDDLKQESMPVTKLRFDRNAYQRELMRARRAKSVNTADENVTIRENYE